MSRCTIHKIENASPNCDMCVKFYRITPAYQEGPHFDPAIDVPDERITTSADLPGFRVVRTCGVVFALEANSGWTATTKGNNALEKALPELRLQARARGANAIVGLAISAFAAGGGITGVLGGDAVGIALVGNAVLVEPVD